MRKLVAQQSLTALALDVLTTVGIVTEAAIAPVLRVVTWLLGSTVYGGLPVTDAVGKDPMLCPHPTVLGGVLNPGAHPIVQMSRLACFSTTQRRRTRHRLSP